jgi:cell division septation protein DedD
VGAFADSAQAEKLAGDLRKKGFTVAIAPGTGDRASRWRVRVGPLVSREDAGRVAEKLRSREKLPTWTLDESH